MVPRTHSRSTETATSVLTAVPTKTAAMRISRSSATAAVMARVMATGTTSARRTVAQVAVRHGSSGPTPIMKISASIIGPLTWSKKGSPTVMMRPVVSSEISGNTTPHSVVKAIPSSSRLLTRNAASRERVDSSEWVLLRTARR